MSDDLFSEQYVRLLDGLSAGDPWPALAESGFLDLLRSEAEGGAGVGLEELLPLAIATGRRVAAPAVIETMLTRLVLADASDVADAEAALTQGGVDAGKARALAAAAAAAQMVGAMERVLEIVLDYANTRKQFGREIGKFQAVQHQIAVAAEEVMAARMAVQLAFTGAPLDISEVAAGIAKARAGQAARQVGPIGHAVLGAIGISQEHELHRY
ncbi:MAG: hypothetical protein JWQ97_3104, partial [Phenylobacterium sp.]|nr:hypothetical protein [Phenylobacterium sp.]